MWFDSHCHLNDEAFQNDLSAVLDQARQAGVSGMMVVGYDLPSSIRAIELAHAYDILWASVGIHPHDAKNWDPEVRREIELLLKDSKVMALGEIGLDYHYDYSPRDDQRRAFREQLELADEYRKPVIIHNREAHGDTLQILSEVGIGEAGGVMHCFSGSKETAAACIKQGLYISFAGPLTFKNAKNLAEVAVEVPLDRILIETDAPYLTPHPFRGERNHPGLVPLVGQKLAELKNETVEAVMEITSRNSRNLFKLDVVECETDEK